MRVLLLCDDQAHPGQVPIDGVAPLAGQGFQFDIITDAKDFRPEMLLNYPVVLLSKSNNNSREDKTPWKSEEVQKAFVSYVENGGGILAVHSGIVAGRDDTILNNLIGSRFVFHPKATPVTVQPVKPHFITEGVGMFCELDEQYRIEVLAPDIDIIIASYSPPQGEESKYTEDPAGNSPAWICPAGYVRSQGKGRICVLTPGHYVPAWLNPQFQKTLVNALNWCAGEN